MRGMINPNPHARMTFQEIQSTLENMPIHMEIKDRTELAKVERKFILNELIVNKTPTV
jgi:hypothetical protein